MTDTELTSEVADQAPIVPFDKSRTALVRRARTMNRILAATYPDAHTELNFSSPLELLVATRAIPTPPRMPLQIARNSKSSLSRPGSSGRKPTL
jgi:hypothetical protein